MDIIKQTIPDIQNQVEQVNERISMIQNTNSIIEFENKFDELKNQIQSLALDVKKIPRITSTPLLHEKAVFGTPHNIFTDKSGNSTNMAKDMPPHISQVQSELIMEEDLATRKLMLQSIPRSDDWPKFYGKSEENFMDFIDFIYGIVDD